MPVLGLIKPKDLIYNLRRLGFEGPFADKRHEFMRKGNLKVYVPNPHEGEISREEWEKLK